METENHNFNKKIPPVFITNIIDFIKLRDKISTILLCDFNATNKNNKYKNKRWENRLFPCDHKIFKGKKTSIIRVDSKAKRKSLP